MKLPTKQGIDEFIELRFKARCWDLIGIPERGCRIRQSSLEQARARGGRILPVDLIKGLMDWLDFTDDVAPALMTLRQLLNRHYPPERQAHARCHFVDEHGTDRLFLAGRVNPERPLVAWQRREWIVALAQPAVETSRMVVAAPQPLSLDAARSILAHSTCNYMNEPYDSFRGAQTSAGGTGAFYGWIEGAVTPIRWDDGLDTHTLAQLGKLGSMPSSNSPWWLSTNQLAVQVAIAGGFLN